MTGRYEEIKTFDIQKGDLITLFPPGTEKNGVEIEPTEVMRVRTNDNRPGEVYLDMASNETWRRVDNDRQWILLED